MARTNYPPKVQTEWLGIKISAELKARLDAVHARTRIPKAELVREGIEMMLTHRETQQMLAEHGFKPVDRKERT